MLVTNRTPGRYDTSPRSVQYVVEVEYSTTGSVNYIHKLETQAPPGAGWRLHLGDIESMGNLQAAALSAADATWVIGGKSFVVTPATDLNDLNSALTVGSTALVDSYTDANGNAVATQIRGVTITSRTDANGNAVATQIRGVTITSRIYLPAVRR